MFQPRNSYVLLRLILDADRQVGRLVVPTKNQKYAQAEVIEVGRDPISAEGGESSTHDLKVGQRVLVAHKEVIKRPSDINPQGFEEKLIPAGLKMQDNEQDDKGDLFLFEQHRIIAIVG